MTGGGTRANLPPMDGAAQSEARRRAARRPRRHKRDADIVLICNPRAGGRWKALAGILDSEEAQHARRIVTDSVEDIADAVDDMAQDAKLLCIYGGDGTIQRVLDRLTPDTGDDLVLALLGGGTMNVTSHWCGYTRNPVLNFRHVVRGYRSGDLMFKEVPLLEIDSGQQVHRAFTFGMGPVVRLLDAYERGAKGKVAALGTAARAIAAAWTGRPATYDELLTPMKAELELDGERIPHDGFAALFANVTGQINPGVEPFAAERTRDTFYLAACAVTAREMSLALPFLVRGWLPLDLGALFERGRFLERLRDPRLLTDPRYINRTASRVEIRTEEPIYTVDGEILEADGGLITVSVGPRVRLAVGPRGNRTNSLSR